MKIKFSVKTITQTCLDTLYLLFSYSPAQLTKKLYSLLHWSFPMHETKFFNDKQTPKISLYKTCLMLNSNVFCVTKDVPTVPRPSFFKPNNNSYQNSPNKMVPPPPPPPPYKPSPSSLRPTQSLGERPLVNQNITKQAGLLPDVLSRPNENHQHSTFLQSRGTFTLLKTRIFPF